MQIGDKVKVIYCDKYDLVGLSGAIVRKYQNLFGVKIEGHSNTKSSYGCFWFKKHQISPFKTEESEGEKMFGEYRTAQVSFMDDEQNRVCAVKYALYDNYDVGDVVVVKTGHHGLAVAKIAAIDAPSARTARVANGREIITRVDMGAYNFRVEAGNRAAELKAAMDARINQLQRMAVLELFSEKDPEMKVMLDEYKALTGDKGQVAEDGK